MLARRRVAGAAQLREGGLSRRHSACFTFADRGAHVLRDVPGEWRLYAVEC